MTLLEVLISFTPFCILAILVLLLGIVSGYFILNRTVRRFWTCPECGRKASGEIIDTEETILSNKVDYQLRNPTRIKVVQITDHYQCKVCKHTWTRSFTRKEQPPKSTPTKN
jgi:rubredoxin